MPPIWIHLGLGLAACAALGALARRDARRAAWLPYLGLGLVVGSVAPDADLLASSLASALAGFDTEVGKDLHRTATHGVPLVVLLLVGGTLAWSPRRRRGAAFAVGLAGGVGALHLLPDLFYLVPVKLWAPFSLDPVGPFGPLVKERFSDAANNAINGVDFAGESLAYLAVWAIARRHGAENRFTQALPSLAVANALIFVPLTLLVAPRATYDEFLVWAYTPGVVFILVTTVLVPWKASRAFLALAGARAPAARA